jgi:hypothetical protein
MSAFDLPLAGMVSAIATVFGSTVTWTSHDNSILPFQLPAVVEQGQELERRDRGMIITLGNVKVSDLAPAINGSADLSVLQGDQVTLASPTWAAGTYRVQHVSDPDSAGTVRVELRKPRT